MKYSLEQSVVLLDTAFKPAGLAIIKGYDRESGKYEIAFRYPRQLTVEQLFVPEERLLPGEGVK